MTTPDKIIDAIERVFGVKHKELKTARKHRNLSDARLAAGYFLSTEANLHPKRCGNLMGRTRTWASFAITRCPELVESDKRYAQRVNAVYSHLKGAAA